MHEGRIMPQSSKGLAAAWHIQGVAPKEICGLKPKLAAGHRVGILDKPIFRYGTASSELVDRQLAAVS